MLCGLGMKVFMQDLLLIFGDVPL